MKKISHLKEKLALTIGYLAIVAVLYFLDVPCLFLTLAKIPCPGCGMTRALFAFLHFDLVTAFTLHPMFWSLPFLYLYFLFDDGLFTSRRANSILLHCIGIGFLMQWVLKIVIC